MSSGRQRPVVRARAVRGHLLALATWLSERSAWLLLASFASWVAALTLVVGQMPINAMGPHDATLDDRRSALPHLHQERAIELVSLKDARAPWSRVRERWAFVDMSFRDVRARVVQIWDEPGSRCRPFAAAGPEATRCASPRSADEPDSLLLNGLPDRPLIDAMRLQTSLAFDLSSAAQPRERVSSPARGRWRLPQPNPLHLAVPAIPALFGASVVTFATLLWALTRPRSRRRRGQPAWTFADISGGIPSMGARALRRLAVWGLVTLIAGAGGCLLGLIWGRWHGG